MGIENIKIGKVYYDSRGNGHTVLRLLNSSTVLVKRPDGMRESLSVARFIESLEKEEVLDFIDPEEEQDRLAVAMKRKEIVLAFSKTKMTNAKRKELAKEFNVSLATVYRWKKEYEKTGKLSSLYPHKKNGGRGKSRINDKIDEIIDNQIQNFYLTPLKPSLAQLHREVKRQCYNSDLTTPSYHLVRRRVSWLTEEEIVRKRDGNKKRDEEFGIKGGSYEEGTHNMKIVQIDHTLLDVMLVDEVNREPLARPYITMAQDVASRAIVGYYVSFDPVGSYSAGMCISNAILPKDDLLRQFNVDFEWPCYGRMKVIHFDNAMEFKGDLVHRACEEYGISVFWRPLNKTNWGGLVENGFRIMKEEVHLVPGTTFADVKDRENYDPAENAALTLKEFEEFILVYVVGIFNKTENSKTRISPLKKWELGALGTKDTPGTGIPYPEENPRIVRLDFMPGFERSIRKDGIRFNHINYKSDVLKIPYFNNKKGKYQFKFNPGNLSAIYFWNPYLKDYQKIPYHDRSNPPISIWEYKLALKHARQHANTIEDEKQIFQAYNRLHEIKDKAILSKKKMRNAKQHKKALSPEEEERSSNEIDHVDQTEVNFDLSEIKFEE